MEGGLRVRETETRYNLPRANAVGVNDEHLQAALLRVIARYSGFEDIEDFTLILYIISIITTIVDESGVVYRGEVVPLPTP